MIIPVILAGGTGSRLWPLSRAQHPKQFHALVSAEPLLADAARRVPSVPPYTPPFVITNEQNRFGVAAAFKHAGLPLESIVLEPEGRSTAPAAAVAAHLAIEKAGPDAIVLLMASDHYIEIRAPSSMRSRPAPRQPKAACSIPKVTSMPLLAASAPALTASRKARGFSI